MRPLAVALRWFVLALAGGLACVLLRAAVATAALGAPLYDWQWYVPLMALVAVFPALAAWRPRLARRRAFRLAGAASLAWLVAGYGGFGAQEQLPLAGAPRLTLSFWAYGDLQSVPDAVLEDVHAAEGAIYLDASSSFADDAGRQALAAGLRRLAAHGIDVVLMPPAGGDFLSVPSADAWAAAAHHVADFVAAAGITNVRGLIGDVEPPRLRTSLDLAGSGAAEFARAVDTLRALQTDLRRSSPALRVGMTGLWPHYLDGADGDADLALTLRSPLDPPGEWDFVNLMTYSSYLPPDQRAWYVFALERAMGLRYPDVARSHLIGLVGGGFPGEPVLDFADLARDARIGRALGVREVVVFQLNGALRVFGDDFVARLDNAVNGPQAEPVVVPFSRPAALVTYGYVALDALLDARGPRALLWLVWAAVSAWLVWRETGRGPT